MIYGMSMILRTIEKKIKTKQKKKDIKKKEEIKEIEMINNIIKKKV
jgi:hypothetical protein